MIRLSRKSARQGKKVDIRDFDKNTWDTVRRLLKYLSPYKMLLIFAIVFSITGTIFNILGPLFMGNTTNYIVSSFRGEVTFDNSVFMKFIIILLGLYILSAASDFMRLYLGKKINAKVSYKLREDISTKMKKLPISFFDNHAVGDILSRMTNDIQAITQTMTQIINHLFKSLVIVIGITVIMIYISPSLTLITLLVIPFILLASYKIIQESQKQFTIQWDDLGDLNAHIEEMFSSNKLVKSYNYEDEAMKQFDEKNERLRISSAKANFYSGILMPISFFINNIGVVGISIVGAYYVLTGRINIGNFQSFIQYSKRFTRPVTMLTEIMSILQAGVAAANRVFQVLDAKEEIPSKESPVDIQSLEPNVEFENVYFGYEEDECIIENLDVKIPAGTTAAIVGPTGSGKTTLVNLLMRFYDVDEGSIKIDGYDVREFSRSDLRNYFGMVLQDTWLFEGTVAENIGYGNPDATREDIIEASKNAYAHNFIMRLPDEYDTILDENGSNISEGQKQLLTIARALVTDPKIMILDEATSSIDTRTEALIQKAMDELVKGRTSFVIAHRLSTIVNADVILVLKDGKIIEKGNHEELLEKGGFYKDLYYSQF